MHISTDPLSSKPGQQDSANVEGNSYKPLYPVFTMPTQNEEKAEKAVLEKEEKK